MLSDFVDSVIKEYRSICESSCWTVRKPYEKENFVNLEFIKDYGRVMSPEETRWKVIGTIDLSLSWDSLIHAESSGSLRLLDYIGNDETTVPNRVSKIDTLHFLGSQVDRENGASTVARSIKENGERMDTRFLEFEADIAEVYSGLDQSK